LAAALTALCACPAEEDAPLDIDLTQLIVVNGASDEVLISIADAVESGQSQVDDTMAAQMVAPAPGQTVPRAAPPQFAWAIPQQKPKPRHGTVSGDFVWLRFENAAFPGPIDVVAVGVTNWTPSAAEWARFTAASGAIKITTTYAFVDGGAIMGGVFQGTARPTFSIAP
jgi:hypothetical protein